MSEAHKDTGYSKEPNPETTQKIKDNLAAKKQETRPEKLNIDLDLQ